MFCLSHQQFFESTGGGGTYKFAQPSQKAAELNNGPDTFEYPHVCKSNFLNEVSVMNKPEEIIHTLMYSSLVYSGSLLKRINHSLANQSLDILIESLCHSEDCDDNVHRAIPLFPELI